MILALTLGAAAGAFAGLLPGVGVFLMLMLAMPILVHWAPLEILLFYAAMMQMSQFLGSLTTIVTGVAGEASSMPTVIEVKKLSPSLHGQLIANTALGSFVAAIVSIAACYWVSTKLTSVSFFYRTEVICALLLTATLLVIKYTENKLTDNVWLFVLGVVLGLVGYNNTLETAVLTFGSVELMQGIPIDVMTLSLFVLPQMYQLGKMNFTASIVPIKTVMPSVNLLRVSWYSVVGFLGGLMPGLTTTFSSIFSYNLASRYTSDPGERILAAETANNSGAVSQLIPMMVFGMPILASEALVLSLMETQGYSASVSTAASYFNDMALSLVAVSVLGLVLAWPLASKVLVVLKMNLKLFRTSAIILMLSVILWQSYVDRNLWYTVYLVIALSMLGAVLRNKDTSGLVFGFLISDKLIDYFSRLAKLYF